ncbi:MAG TPA: DUF1080 domain-containing protein [Lacipirellulaceae bacterium]|nr:DUF1080 domain-containing protein [Lacipirellulaceae bacterium]
MNSHPTRLRLCSAILTALLIVLLVRTPARAQENNHPPKGFTALFNGHDFNNWIGGLGDADWRAITSMPADKRAERQKKLNEGIQQHWHVQDGVLVTDGNPGFFLSTPRDYGDFEMWVDWKINNKSDSGIYLRGNPQVQIWDPKNPDVAKMGAPKGSGALWNNKHHQRFPLVLADKPVGEWNRMFIRMVGPYVFVKLNGKKTVDNVPMENYYDAKTQVPLRGPIYLQTHTTKLYFRNIFIREIPPKEADHILAKIAGHEPDFKPLFNGKDRTGWTGATDGYKVVDGTLVNKAGRHGNLFTDDTYDNFALRFEFKLPPAGNNGIGLRSPLTQKEVAYEGMESQILDDGAPDYAGWLHPYQTQGSLYGLAPAVRGYLRPVGQWNYEEIVLDDDHLTVHLNGFEILNTDIAKDRQHPLDGKKHPGAFRTDGHIGLLGHHDPVAFRNIRVKRLPPKKS